jgi:hypothetical protein
MTFAARFRGRFRAGRRDRLTPVAYAPQRLRKPTKCLACSCIERDAYHSFDPATHLHDKAPWSIGSAIFAQSVAVSSRVGYKPALHNLADGGESDALAGAQGPGQQCGRCSSLSTRAHALRILLCAGMVRMARRGSQAAAMLDHELTVCFAWSGDLAERVLSSPGGGVMRWPRDRAYGCARWRRHGPRARPHLARQLAGSHEVFTDQRARLRPPYSAVQDFCAVRYNGHSTREKGRGP